MAKGMGFKAAAASVAKKSGMPAKQARAVVAATTRKASPAAKKANPALKKVAAKKAMADPMCPPGSMSGTKGAKQSGLGVKKAAKATPRAKAMGEVGIKRVARKSNDASDKVRKSSRTKLPSQSRINPPISGKGTANSSGSDQN